jgi:ribosomal-protein-alanine N-acetyltransferase
VPSQKHEHNIKIRVVDHAVKLEYSKVRAPERIETDRLVLRKPTLADAEAVFSRYASDPQVTKFMSWPRHRSIDDTLAFLAFSNAEWEKWPAGPYLIEASEGVLLGSTGLSFENEVTVETGYVLAVDAWGRGYATEALNAVVRVARDMGVRRLHAHHHPENVRSARVLQKCGFRQDSVLRRSVRFPNLDSGQAVECPDYSRTFN